MPAHQSQRVKQIFQATIDLRGDERDRVLAEGCDGDVLLRTAVEILLGAEPDVRPCFLEGLAVPTTSAAFPSRIGRYELVRRIGEGGMGSVFEAVQDSPRRSVALKLLKVGLFSSDALRRFEYETQVLASLRHPGIAQIYEAGTQAIGGASVPYFAMELVPDARPITEFARVAGLDVQRRLELFVEVCDAIQHGHQRGVIHRDLKPSNIVVDSGGRPRIIDFGVARAVRGDGAAATVVTSPGQIIGTLAYMSPEQCGGDPQDLDIRSDVYSLGVVLYELLCERLPFDIGRTDVLEAVRIIREEPPARPSAVQRVLRGDLETIVLKALDKDRARRYQTAGELAHDVRQFLANEPIDARRDSSLYLLRKMVRRHRAAFAVLIAFIVLVTGSAFVAWSLLLRAVRSEQLAQDRFKQAEYKSYVANIAAADGAIAAHDGGAALARLNEAPAALRNWEWRFLRRNADSSIATFYGLATHHMRHVGFSPNGRYLAGVSHWGELQSQLDVWDWMSGASVLKAAAGDDRTISFFVVPYHFVQNPLRLNVYSGNGTLIGYELEHGRELERASIPGLQPGGTLALAAPPVFVSASTVDSYTGMVRYWNQEIEALYGEFALAPSSWINASACAPDGRRFALGMPDGAVYLCNVASNARPQRFKAHAESIHGLTFSADGHLLATSSEDGQIRIWRIANDDASPELVISIHGSSQRVGSVAFNPDGSKLAAASADKALRVWNVADGELLYTLLGHAGALCAVAFHPDEIHLATGSYDATVKLWDLSQPLTTVVRRDLPGYLDSVAFDADGIRLMVGTTGGALVLDAANGHTIFELPHTPGEHFFLFDAAGSRAIVGCDNGAVRVLELPAGHETNRFAALPNGGPRLAMNRAGTQLACVLHEGGVVTLREPASGTELRRFEHGHGQAYSLAYRPDGGCLATGSTAGETCLWDCINGGQLWATRAHTSRIRSVAFSQDGSRLATGGDDATIKVFDARTGRVQMTLCPQLGDVWCMAFSPDGTRLAAGGRDRTVRLFDTETGQEVLSLRGPRGTVMCVAFSLDGRQIAAGSWAREIFIWDSRTADNLSP